MDFSCPSPAAMEELQRAADYRMVRKENIRQPAVMSLVVGAGALFLGIYGFHVNAPNAVLALIGGFLMVDAVWIFVSPTPRAIILDGFALLTFGVWSIFVGIHEFVAIQYFIAFYNVTVAGDDFAGILVPFAILGIWGIVGSFDSFRCYARFRHMPVPKPSPDLVAKIDQIVKEIKKSKPKTDPNVIEFDVWKGRLAPDFATFVDATGQQVVFAKPADVSFTLWAKVRPNKEVVGAFEIGSRTLKGTRIAPESFQRYLAWRERAVPDAAAKPAVRLSMDLQRTIASVNKRRWEKRERGEGR